MKAKLMKVLSIAAAASMVLGSVSVSAAEETADITYDGGEVTLTFETITSSMSDWYVNTLPEMVHEKFPNITVETVNLPSNDMKSDVKMKFASGEGPDFFQWWAGKQSSALVEAGYLMDLSDLPVLDNFREDMVKSFATDDVDYAVPLGSSFLTTWYNTSMFEDAGITAVPTNWQEFLDCCEALKSAGYTPIVMGDKDAYVLQFGLYMAAASCVYAENPDFDYQLGTETKFTDDGWKETLAKYQQLYDSGYVIADSLGISHDQARQAFIDGEAAMTFDGSFGWDTLMGKGAAEFERGIFCLPTNEEGETQVVNLTPAEGIFANGQVDEERQAAIKAVLTYWFTEGTPLFESWAENNNNIPCENSLSDSRDLVKNYLEMYDGYQTVYNCNNEWPDGVSDAMTSKFQEVITGSATSDDVAEAMEMKLEEMLDE